MLVLEHYTFWYASIRVAGSSNHFLREREKWGDGNKKYCIIIPNEYIMGGRNEPRLSSLSCAAGEEEEGVHVGLG